MTRSKESTAAGIPFVNHSQVILIHCVCCCVIIKVFGLRQRRQPCSFDNARRNSSREAFQLLLLLLELCLNADQPTPGRSLSRALRLLLCPPLVSRASCQNEGPLQVFLLTNAACSIHCHSSGTHRKDRLAVDFGRNESAIDPFGRCHHHLWELSLPNQEGEGDLSRKSRCQVL